MTIRVWSVAALAAVLVLLGTAAPAFSQPNLAVTQMFVNPDPPKANLALDLRFAVLNNGSAANPSGYQLGVSCVNKNPSGPPCAFANTSLPLLQIAPGTTTNVGTIHTNPWKPGDYTVSVVILVPKARSRPVPRQFDLLIPAASLAPNPTVSPTATAVQPRTVQPAARAAAKIDPNILQAVVPKADLAVSVHAPAYDGDVLRVEVENAGNADAGSFLVRVTCKTKCDQFPWQPCGNWMKEHSVPGVLAGKTHILRWKKVHQPPFPGHYCWNLFEAVADPWLVVPESNENNNKSSATSSGE